MGTNQEVLVYLRCSTLEQSTDLQRREIDRFLEQRGWGVAHYYEDKASGTNSNRPQLKLMMNDIRSGHGKMVVVWRLDRFARSLKDLITMLQELSERNVAFISIKDNIDLTTSTGRLMVHLLGAFAQFEADLIKERVLAGLSAAKARGRKLGRPSTVNPDPIRQLRSKGLSVRQIASRLGISKSAVHKSLSKSRLQAPEKTGGKNAK